MYVGTISTIFYLRKFQMNPIDSSLAIRSRVILDRFPSRNNRYWRLWHFIQIAKRRLFNEFAVRLQCLPMSWNSRSSFNLSSQISPCGSHAKFSLSNDLWRSSVMVDRFPLFLCRYWCLWRFTHNANRVFFFQLLGTRQCPCFLWNSTSSRYLRFHCSVCDSRKWRV